MGVYHSAMTAIQPEALATMLDTSWMQDAACGGFDTREFFRSRNSKVKAVCVECPVRGTCLDYALVTDQYGVWGGMTESERNRRFSKTFREAMREDYVD